MPQLSPLMWGLSFIMFLFFLFGLVLLESSYFHGVNSGSLATGKKFVSMKW